LVGDSVRAGEDVLTIRSRFAISHEQIGEWCQAIISISTSSMDAPTLFLE